MADWQRKLDIADVWPSEDVKLISKTIVERLKLLKPFDNDYIDNWCETLIDEFEDLTENESADVKDFDYIFEELYDWGDISLDGNWNVKKVCWVKTF